ncbi:hypothetical protein PVAP13_5NG265104 [Panicum virgatum]|uniref:Uncharacterized protein n=1 Tax=Panicum virgatum TaxID=38727 RepID=A0A8T0SAY0_PANVG|nr:hypothetical protein PVAP13_5NG265104 [Panicum virgatum]
MEHDEADDGGGGQQFDAAASSPICGLHSGSKGRAAGYRMLSTRSSPVVGRRRVVHSRVSGFLSFWSKSIRCSHSVAAYYDSPLLLASLESSP